MASISENKVIKAGIGYTIGNYFLKGLNFLTIPLFSRIMSTADYGIYNTFAAYESILFIVMGVAIHTSYKNARYKYGLVEEGTNRGRDYNTYVSSTMVLLVVSAGIWFLIANILSSQISKIAEIDQVSINLLLIYCFSTAVLQCFNSDVALRYQFQSFLKVSAVNAIGNIVLSITLMLTVYSKQRYMGRIIGTTVPIFVLAIFIVFKYIRRAKPINNSFFLKWGIRYSLPIVPHGISQVVLSQFDRIMINNMIGASVAGIYSFAYNMYTIINVTVQSLDNVWNSWFYEQMNAKQYDKIKQRATLYMLGMLLFTTILMLVSPEMIKVLGSREYWDASYCVIPIITGGYFSFLYTIPSAIEYFHEKTKYIALGTIGAAVINIALNYVCIREFGYIAAAYTTLFTYLLYFIVHFLLAWKVHGACIFSRKVVVFSCIFILIANFATLYLIDYIFLRWMLAVCLAIVVICFVEKKFQIVSKMFIKIRGGRKDDR